MAESGLGDLDWIEGVDGPALLEAEWRAHEPRPEWVAPLGSEFPGLAPGAEVDLETSFDPFDMAERAPARLLVVPCNRPADALTAVGFGGVQLGSERLSAIMRTWEERFGAAVTQLDPGCTVLRVETPPRDLHTALLLAAEHFAVAPREDAGRPGSLAEEARLLQGPPTWTLYWRG